MIGFIFPGQGSQTVGMLNAFSGRTTIVEEWFAKASAVLGYDLWELAQQGPAEQLNQTEFTQPALLAADVALWHCWQAHAGAKPSVMAGHSLGEYSALVCAGALAFTDAVSLVAKRGRYMQAAVAEGVGAMAAVIGLDDAQVAALCDEFKGDEVLSPANFNSVGQVVIAGHKTAVTRAVAAAKDKGAKLAKLIPVSVPSHCQLMQSAADELADDLAAVSLHAPTIPVIQNADVVALDDPLQIRAALVKQLTQPVRWVETIQRMQAQAVQDFVECGPGKVLAGLNKRIDKSFNTYSIDTPDLLQAAVDAVVNHAA